MENILKFSEYCIFNIKTQGSNLIVDVETSFLG